MIRMGQLMASACQKNPLTPFINTDATARDLDLARSLIASPGLAYGAVFAAEALLFLFSAILAARIGRPAAAAADFGALAPSRP